MTNDILERFTFENKPLRGEYVHLQTSIQAILSQHPYSQPMKRLLAESLAIVSLLSAMIKLNGRITLQFQGKNGFKFLLAQANSKHEIRGLIKHEKEGATLSYDQIIHLMKEGLLVVMLELDEHPGNPYQGIVEWRGESLTEAIEAYFENSEQLLTRIWLHFDAEKHTISGCMLQALPTQDNQINIDFFKIAQQLEKTWYQHDDFSHAKSLLTAACPEDDIQLFLPIAMRFKCTCSKNHSEQAIRLLGQIETEDEIKKNGTIVVTCEFCAERYQFDRIDVAAIFKLDDSSDTIH